MKKLFYLVAFVLCLGLAACGGGKTDPDPKPGPGPDVTPVAVTGVKLSQETAELQVGDKLKLSATVSPSDATDKIVTWASSNTSVASVAGGEVTALAAGSTDITATAGGITATCKVTVKEVDVPYVFSLDPKSVNLSAEGGDFVITVTCTGGYHMQSKPDWITEKSVNDKKHTFTAAANESSEERSGVIVFCDDVGTCLPVRVKQAESPSAEAGAGTEDVTDGSPVNW